MERSACNGFARIARVLVLCLIPLFTVANPLLGEAYKKGHILIMRHALAPGTGDPSLFSFDDCTTQRNLDAAGRAQATAIGRMLREQGWSDAPVYTSQWCRCRDTATLLDLGDVQDLPVLNSFFGAYEREAAQTQALREWLATQAHRSPMVLVTHQVNITALTGVYPKSGEIIILERQAEGGLAVKGRVARSAR